MDDLTEIMQMLLAHMKAGMQADGMGRMDVCEMGCLADMVKDLAYAKKCCRKAEYYETVTKAMHDATPEEVSRMRMA